MPPMHSPSARERREAMQKRHVERVRGATTKLASPSPSPPGGSPPRTVRSPAPRTKTIVPSSVARQPSLRRTTTSDSVLGSPEKEPRREQGGGDLFHSPANREATPDEASGEVFALRQANERLKSAVMALEEDVVRLSAFAADHKSEVEAEMRLVKAHFEGQARESAQRENAAAAQVAAAEASAADAVARLAGARAQHAAELSAAKAEGHRLATAHAALEMAEHVAARKAAEAEAVAQSASAARAAEDTRAAHAKELRRLQDAVADAAAATLAARASTRAAENARAAAAAELAALRASDPSAATHPVTAPGPTAEKTGAAGAALAQVREAGEGASEVKFPAVAPPVTSAAASVDADGAAPLLRAGAQPRTGAASRALAVAVGGAAAAAAASAVASALCGPGTLLSGPPLAARLASLPWPVPVLAPWRGAVSGALSSAASGAAAACAASVLALRRLPRRLGLASAWTEAWAEWRHLTTCAAFVFYGSGSPATPVTASAAANTAGAATGLVAAGATAAAAKSRR